VPFVTGHKYKIHWGKVGLDWDGAVADMSERWTEADKSIYLVHNFTDQRAHMDVHFNDVLIKNDTIPKFESQYSPGQHVLFEDETVREFHFIINGKDMPTD
jgi:hypothetical protein